MPVYYRTTRLILSCYNMEHLTNGWGVTTYYVFWLATESRELTIASTIIRNDSVLRLPSGYVLQTTYGNMWD